jgi:hypothetical protein
MHEQLVHGASAVAEPRSEVLLQVHARIQLADLRFVAVEHQRLALLGEQPPSSPMRRSVAWLQRGWSTFGFTFE